MKGYCVKCKAPKPIADAVEQTMTNGRKALKGKCGKCGAGMFKILSGKAKASSKPASAAAPKTTQDARPESPSPKPGFRLTFFHN